MDHQNGKAEDFLPDLAALQPVYHRDYGDASYIYLKSGQVILDNRSIRGVKQALARLKALDQAHLRRLCGQELGHRLNLPLPLSAQLMLVPLKMRQPLTENDSAYGLVNLVAVRKVLSCAEGGSMVLLESGQSLKVLANRETCLTHLGEGTLLHRHFMLKVWEI